MRAEEDRARIAWGSATHAVLGLAAHCGRRRDKSKGLRGAGLHRTGECRQEQGNEELFHRKPFELKSWKRGRYERTSTQTLVQSHRRFGGSPMVRMAHHAQTGSWSARIDGPSSRSGLLQVEGVLASAEAGYALRLRKIVPQGYDPRILTLRLEAHKSEAHEEEAGAQDAPASYSISYSETDARYKYVSIFPCGVTVPVGSQPARVREPRAARHA